MSASRRLVDILALTDGYCRNCEALCILRDDRCVACRSPHTRRLTEAERQRLKAEVVDPAHLQELRADLAAARAAQVQAETERETFRVALETIEVYHCPDGYNYAAARDWVRQLARTALAGVKRNRT